MYESINKDLRKIQSVDRLIERKYMLVNAEKFHVAVLAELWNYYSADEKHNFCRNVMTYCKMENAFNGVPEKENIVMLISIKDSKNNVIPFAYFRNDAIELITVAPRKRKPWYKRIVKK